MPRNADREVDAYLASVAQRATAAVKGPRGLRNNNPGNIRPGQGFYGEVGVDDGNYAIFDTMDNGLRAIAVDLRTKHARGLVSIRQIISTYAPPSENNTAAYIAAVERRTGFNRDAWLNFSNSSVIEAMVDAIVLHELGLQPFSHEQLVQAVARSAR